MVAFETVLTGFEHMCAYVAGIELLHVPAKRTAALEDNPEILNDKMSAM